MKSERLEHINHTIAEIRPYPTIAMRIGYPWLVRWHVLQRHRDRLIGSKCPSMLDRALVLRGPIMPWARVSGSSRPMWPIPTSPPMSLRSRSAAEESRIPTIHLSSVRCGRGDRVERQRDAYVRAGSVRQSQRVAVPLRPATNDGSPLTEVRLPQVPSEWPPGLEPGFRIWVSNLLMPETTGCAGLQVDDLGFRTLLTVRIAR